jgi:peptide/nickel transport system substrate-binding protein
LFNATLALIDDKAVPRAQLVNSLPQLNSDTWRVFPDGRMETTYRLKPNLTWHDGQPLTADDFVFSWRMYTTPDFGVTTQPPLVAIS